MESLVLSALGVTVGYADGDKLRFVEDSEMESVTESFSGSVVVEPLI